MHDDALRRCVKRQLREPADRRGWRRVLRRVFSARLLRSSPLSRKEASIRSVRPPLPRLWEKKNRGAKNRGKKGEDGKKRARPGGWSGIREGGEGRRDIEWKEERGERGARRVSARWISAKFQRALTREKCQSEQKNRGRERKNEGQERGLGK
jgi:hypothetical protein